MANFLKHADRDKDKSLSGIDLHGLNEIDLQLCILAFTRVKPIISPKLNLGFCYLSLLEGAILPIDLASAKFGPSIEQPLRLLRDLDRTDLRVASLDAFERLLQA